MSEDIPPSKSDTHFDFINWFYWTLWWQQYYYNTPHYWATSGVDSSSSRVPSSNVVQQNDTNGVTYLPRDFSSSSPGIGLQIRIINGYETVIAPLWKRFCAEMIDMLLFGLLLKIYIPDFEYRVPEIVFESSDIWSDMDEGELLQIRRLILHFLFSTVVQRIIHAALETLFVSFFGWTPGKWLLGLRIIKCTSSHLTRAVPGVSVRVEPGGKISFLQALLRAMFKGTVSAFIPLIIFFFNLSHGRTRYDRLFGSIVVDISSLNRPVFVDGQRFHHLDVNVNQRQGVGQLFLQVQLDDTVTEPGQLGNAIDNEEMVEQLDSTIDRDPLKPLVWEDSLTRLLIDYYRENPCLYDVASKEYLDRDLKRKVVEGIAMKLGTNSIEVNKKVHCLRTQFKREKNKMKQRRGTSENGAYVTKWSYYEQMQFLDDYVTSRSSTKKHSDRGSEMTNADYMLVDNADNEGSFLDYIETDETLSKGTAYSKERRKRKLIREEDVLLTRTLDCMEKATNKKVRAGDRYDIFGQFVASEMREILDPEWSRWAKQKILNILCSAQSGGPDPESST